LVAERRYRVPPEAKGARLDAQLSSAFRDLSRSRVQQLIAAGHVRIDGKAGKAATRLKGGECVVFHVPPPEPVETLPEDLPLRVLYEDADLLVLDKAAGMVVHPAAGHRTGTLVNALIHRVPDLDVGGQLRPGIVHRLDRDTTGCLLVAKRTRTLEALQDAFKRREVTKTYLALVMGEPPSSYRIETLYGRHPRHRKKFSGRVATGKPALTETRTVEAFGDAALLEVQLHTGRTHQIRVHLSEAGHPLLGDVTYGKTGAGRIREIQRALGRQALHAWRLAFRHPRTQERMTFEAPVPDDFARALAALRAS
jgi:23S rRNA pseudouridine1911/1915/1917 synthase